MKRMTIIALRRLLKKSKALKRMLVPRFIICDCGELMKLNKSKDFFHCNCGTQISLPKNVRVVGGFGRPEIF